MTESDLLDWLYELDQYLLAVVKYAAESRLAQVELERARYAAEGHQPDFRNAEYLLRNNERFLYRNLQYVRGLITRLHSLAYPHPDPPS